MTMKKACLAIVSTILLVGYNLPTQDPSPLNGSEIDDIERLSRGTAAIAKHSTKAVVFVSVSKTVRGMAGQVNPFDFFFGPGHPFGGRGLPPREQKQKGLGSGFIVDLEKGYVITNNHVIEGADEITLKFANGITKEAKVLGRDENTDVAIVQVKDSGYNKDGLGQLMLADSEKVQVGEFVFALGSPFGLESSLSFGTVSAIGRSNLNITDLGNFIQTDAAINPGNSGGPLLNTRGQVIGMNTAIYSRSGSSAGIGFAVPANIVRNIVEQLINDGKIVRGFLGVTLQELDEDLLRGLGLSTDTTGALVAKVQPETPAEKSGLESGDVIYSADGKPVRNVGELRSRIGLIKPGKSVELKFYRDGKKRSVDVTLGNFPSKDDPVASDQPAAEDGYGGMGLQDLGKLGRKKLAEAQEEFGFRSRDGLLVLGVEPGSKAQAAGLRRGDVIVKVNNKVVKNKRQFQAAYKSATSPLLLHIERDGTYLFASLRK